MIQTEIDPDKKERGGIPVIWDRGVKGEELKGHHEWLRNGMNYWDELREILRIVFNQNRRGEVDFSEPNWAYHQAYRAGYEKALQDIFKILPRPKE